jgi:hypothetical protein
LDNLRTWIGGQKHPGWVVVGAVSGEPVSGVRWRVFPVKQGKYRVISQFLLGLGRMYLRNFAGSLELRTEFPKHTNREFSRTNRETETLFREQLSSYGRNGKGNR